MSLSSDPAGKERMNKQSIEGGLGGEARPSGGGEGGSSYAKQ